MSKLRPLGNIQCPKCAENDRPESVVMCEIDEGRIKQLVCRYCTHSGNIGDFNV